jgi:hypothetical protein
VDDRAVSPVVGKALEVAVLVVFVGLVSAALFGSVVPAYRTAAGAEVGDRVLVAAAGQIEVAADVPAAVTERRTAVVIPRTIRGAAYAVRVDPGNATGPPTLVLDHPHGSIGGATALSLPPQVVTVTGTTRSTASPTVVVYGRPGGRVEVTLE